MTGSHLTSVYKYVVCSTMVITLQKMRSSTKKFFLNRPMGWGFTSLFTKLAVDHPRVIPSSPEKLSLVGPIVWEKIANIQTDRETDRRTGRQTGRQTDGKTERQTDRQSSLYIFIYKHHWINLSETLNFPLRCDVLFFVLCNSHFSSFLPYKLKENTHQSCCNL